MSLHVTVYIAPENIDHFFAAFKPVFDKVITEPECLFFEVFQNPGEPGKISWVEDWSKSPEWFLEDQITKDYYKDYLAVTEPMFLKPREFQVLERLSPEYYYSRESV
jgi:quinol monooxygenase YgiN